MPSLTSGYVATGSFTNGGLRAAIPDCVSVDPFTVSALAAANALADLNGDVDVIEFVRNLPAVQSQVVGLAPSMLHVGMGEANEVIADKIFRDETTWRDHQYPGERSSAVFGRTGDLRVTRDRLAIHVFTDSSFMKSITS